MLTTPQNDYDYWPPVMFRLRLTDEEYGNIERELGIGGNDARRPILRTRITEILLAYSADLIYFTAPPRQWYNKQLEPLRAEINKTTKKLKELKPNVRYRLADAMKVPSGGLLSPDDGRLQSMPLSVLEEILTDLAQICETVEFAPSARRGPKSKVLARLAASRIIDVWTEITEKKFNLTFHQKDTPHGQREFTAPNLRFAKIVLKALDPIMTDSGVIYALRQAKTYQRNSRCYLTAWNPQPLITLDHEFIQNLLSLEKQNCFFPELLALADNQFPPHTPIKVRYVLICHHGGELYKPSEKSRWAG
jgi:hypothetical protein